MYNTFEQYDTPENKNSNTINPVQLRYIYRSIYNK